MTTVEESAPSQVTDRITRITMPKWGLSMESGKVTDWFVGEGDELTEGQDICEIDTDKIAGALESTWSGTVRALVVETMVDVPVGGTIALVAGDDVPQEEIDAALAEAREQLASGDIVDDSGPRLGTVDVGGVTIAYAVLEPEDAVTGAPVVFVHGYGGDKDSWMFVQEPIAAHRVTYAIDLPGHGASGKDVGAGTVESLAATVIGFLDALNLSTVHLVGHSMGGAVVTAVAGNPAVAGRVTSLTLVSPAGYGPEINAEYIRGFAAAETRRELKPHLLQLFADQSLVQRQLIDDLLRYKRIDGVDAALATLSATLVAGVDVTPAQASFAGPTVVVWGAEDRIVPASNAAALDGRATVHLVDGAGHMAHMEKPHDVVAAIHEAVGSN
ncbi:acetoin dehydrogenase dihydrolipoyllysine-residue acetyltransferase subunit [Nakamurella sp.]|uniref:acetoin dehydrogenase dihydrolipoyllysine-residue acetyltransferase subunit n=1 Tax=Nakamurella sp. TaxID=1869182 RepID=UPI0037830DAD